MILSCACPNEATVGKMALLLRRKGIRKVRPPAGGLDAWRERSYPLEALSSVEARTGFIAESGKTIGLAGQRQGQDAPKPRPQRYPMIPPVMRQNDSML